MVEIDSLVRNDPSLALPAAAGGENELYLGATATQDLLSRFYAGREL
jgi:hypothetical protein